MGELVPVDHDPQTRYVAHRKAPVLNLQWFGEKVPTKVEEKTQLGRQGLGLPACATQKCRAARTPTPLSPWLPTMGWMRDATAIPRMVRAERYPTRASLILTM